MRASGTSDIPHVKMTDHWVRKRPKDPKNVTLSDRLEPLLPSLTPELSPYRQGLLGLAYADLVRFNQRQELIPTALRLLGQAAQNHPKWPELWSALGEVSSIVGDRIAALSAYQRYADLKPYDEFYRLREAAILNVVGESARAQEILQLLVQRRPSQHRALELLGSIALQQRRLDDAERWYREADRHGPYEHSIAHNQGFLALMRGDLKRARSQFTEGVRRDGISREGPFYLGILSAAEGQHDIAITHYRHALQRDPRFAQVYPQLTRSLYTLGRSDEALQELITWTQREPHSADAHLWLAQALDRAGRLREAYDLLWSAQQRISDPRLGQALQIAAQRSARRPQ